MSSKSVFAAVFAAVVMSPAMAQTIMPPERPLMPPPVIPPPRLEVRGENAKPMQTREMRVSASVSGLRAIVETTIVFHNPNPRLLEGELVFPLPDGAAVCGYGLDIDGVMVDGVVVTKEKARVAFESETRRRVDPGLVEHVVGNLYRTRVYPLPANGQRTIRLAYTTPLALAPDGAAALLLPMPREQIGKLSVKIEVAATDAPAPKLGGLGDQRFARADNFWRVESVVENAKPGEDVLVAMPELPATLATLEKDAEGKVWFLISAMAPAAPAKETAAPAKTRILWDASGSRSNADLSRELKLIAQLPGRTFELIVFRDIPEPSRLFDSAAALLAAIKEAPFDGGSDFERLAAAAPDDGVKTLLFSDGIDTLSGQPVEFRGGNTIALVSAVVADREGLRQACAGALVDLLVADPAAALAEIANPSPRVSGVRGGGVANVQGVGRPAVGRVTLLGQLSTPEATIHIEYANGAVSAPFVLRAADAREGRTLALAWAASRVNQLSPRAELFEEELLVLGRAYGLVSPATSLIVLESLDQWVNHEIEPPATLPRMREQWLQAMKNRNKDTDSGRERHLRQLASLWRARVEWWKTDFSKVVIPSQANRDENRRQRLQEEALLDAGAGEDAADMREREMAAESVSDTWGASPAAAALAPRAMRASADVGESTAEFSMDAASAAKSAAAPDGGRASAIRIKEWSPDVPYLKNIRAAAVGQRYAAYLAERPNWERSPAFFLDCAGEFLKGGDTMLGIRILTNLAEMRVEDAALLRVLAWRLRQAGELDRAVVILRRVAKLRPEEPQSFRDLALALTERGRELRARQDLEEAMEQYLRVALNPWNRHGGVLPVFALEELNALAAWVNRQEWKPGDKPSIPDYDEQLRDNLDTDLRIVMSWDADATDIDLHVVEPGGDTAYYGHNRTRRGGLVSQDVTDGYGPEEYMIRVAPNGKYLVKANYYGSSQQTVVGPATVTATVFTNWGRHNEQRQTITARLDQPRAMVEVGSVLFGQADAVGQVVSPADFAALRPGMTREAAAATVGAPEDAAANPWLYRLGARAVAIHFDKDGRLVRAVEILPGGIENIIVQ